MFRVGIFGGGGSNGDWQAGRLLALKDNGYTFDILTGTSVGALNALAEACGLSHILEGVWTTLNNERIIDKSALSKAIIQEGLSHIGLAKERKSLYSSKPLREYLDELFLGKKCQIDYWCSVVLVGNGTPNRYMKHFIRKGDTISNADLDMVWASTAIPIVFREVDVSGYKYFDGGVLQSTPMRHTIRHYPTTHMTAIVCQPFGKMNTSMGKGLVGRAGWTIQAMLRSQFEKEWENMRHWNQAIGQWEKHCPDKPLIIDGLPVKHIVEDLHAPDRELGDLLNFDNSKTAHNFYEGYHSFKTVIDN